MILHFPGFGAYHALKKRFEHDPGNYFFSRVGMDGSTRISRAMKIYENDQGIFYILTWSSLDLKH